MLIGGDSYKSAAATGGDENSSFGIDGYSTQEWNFVLFNDRN